MAETETALHAQNRAVAAANIHSADRDAEIEIDLGELFLRLLDKWYVIVAAALVGAMLSGIWTFFFVTPQYEATTKLYILNSDDSVINLSSLQLGSQLANDYTYVFSNWHVHETVIDKLDLDYTYKDMQKMVRVNNPSNTRLLEITVTSPNAEEAQLIANTYALVAPEFIAKVMKTVEPSIFQEARLPTTPVSPSKARNLILGFLIGAFLAVGVITVMFVMDDKVRTSDDVTKLLGLPTLGVVTMQNSMHGEHNRSGKGAKK